MAVTYWGSAAAVATALVAYLVTGLRARFDAIAVLLWAAVAALGTVATVLVLDRMVGVTRFGAVNVVYRQLVLGLPLAAALIGVRAMRRGWRGSTGVLGRLVIVGSLLLAPLGVWMSVVEPNRLVVRHETLAVPGLSDGQQLRIGVISDVQIGASGPGSHEQRAIEALMAEQPDVVLFAGDVVQSSRAAFDENLPELRELLGQLRAPGGAYIVLGDVDEHYEFQQLGQGTSLRWLSDEVVTTQVGGATVAIGGIDLDPDAPGAQRIADELETRHDQAGVRILLAHRPDAVALLPASGTRTDLVVAGHTHGGQIVLPFLGPVMTLTDVPREVAAGGLHRMGSRNVYVSTGVGVERHQAPKVRLLDPPTVALVTLTS